MAQRNNMTRRAFAAAGLAVAFAPVSGCAPPLPSATPEIVDIEAHTPGFTHEITNTDKTVVVDIWAKWCPPCEKNAPYLEKFIRQHADTVKLVRVDASVREGIHEAYGVKSLPAYLVYKNGVRTCQIEALEDPKDMIRLLREAVAPSAPSRHRETPGKRL